MTMDYREKPRDKPLIWALCRRVIAIDPNSGAKLWEHKLERHLHRTFLFEEALFVTYEKTLLALDLYTGEPIETIELAFEISAVLAEEERVFLAGGHGMACMGAGKRILWSVGTETEGEAGFFTSGPRSMICRDAKGNEMWRSDPDLYYANSGLLLGDRVVQRDLES
jgi:outer membrane protein assembly factor BamB